jgi:glycosyltransferase involved in cell wall biosynthesis
MAFYKIEDLPPPPEGKTGFPWTTAGETAIEATVLSDNLPKISIITPSFNQGPYIEETIRSILLQGYPNLEFIVMDGGSTDETVEILKKYDRFISFWTSQRDAGQSDAINQGIERATGDIFNWINSDDLLAPNALRHLAAIFQKNPDAQAVCGNYLFIGTGIPSTQPQRLLMFSTVEKTLALGGMSQPSLFWRLDTIKQLKGVNQKLHYTMDWELWHRFFLTIPQPKVVLTNAILAHFRWHETSKSVSAAPRFHSEQFGLFSFILSKMPEKFRVVVAEMNQQIPPQYQAENEQKYAAMSWQFTQINPSKYAAYALEYVADVLSHTLDRRTFWRLFAQSLRFLPFGRGRFYALPFLVFRRKYILKK